MTLYLVKHGSGDYRLHEETGAETGDSWSWESDYLSDRAEKRQRADSVDDAAGDGWVYRDLTRDAETVPW